MAVADRRARGRRPRRSAPARRRARRARGRRCARAIREPTARARTDTGWPPPVARRVLQQVGEGALELGGVGADERQVGGDRAARRSRAAARCRRRRPGRPPRPSTTPRAARRCRPPGATGRAACRPGATSRPASPTMSATSSRALGPGDSELELSAPAAVEDRRQRRAQVVGDGAQQRGLEHVGAPQRRGLDDLALQARRARARRRGCASSAGTTRSRRRSQDGGLEAGGHEQRAERRLAASARATRRSSPGTDRAARSRPRQLERLGQPLRDGGQRLVEARAAQQQPRHLGGQVGLLAALVRLARARRACARPACWRRAPRRRRRRARPSSRPRRS